LSFRYFDTAGDELLNGGGTAVARIDIVMRAESSRPRGLSADGQGLFRDSTVFSVSPRNRLR